MKSSMVCKGVGNGLVHMVNRFCQKINISSPIRKQYTLNERIPLEEWFRILGYLNKHYHENDLAIQLGELSELESMGLITYLSMYCKSVREVFQIYARYQKVWYDIVNFNRVENKDEFVIYWNNPAYIEAGLYMKEMRIALMVGLCVLMKYMSDLALSAKFKVEKIELRLANVSLAETKRSIEHFSCPVVFKAESNRICFRREMLELEISTPNQDEYLRRILTHSADVQLERYSHNTNFKELIYSSIVTALQENRTDIQYVAEKIGLKPRVIQNRLKQYNCSYSEQLAEVRKMLAFHYLENEDLTIGEISILLGYQEQASFHHTFKLWTGKSPRRWRLERGAA
ncbi:hypothetical protein F945_03083 [Acinetobacter rudis CIP 110305]|uniref:HTH araC/xylS-type domain-containing protein n=1 Tax=Acinetobacter rudis CIP 110305 TaxID=421052 RepID=S3NTS1_9GAMM|nr:hypothetical protein F945_03083 [Acinetobacter rudis CIP 110305]